MENMITFVPFFGIVEDRYDPQRLGRLKVRIFGIHSDNRSELPTIDLPWAYPIVPINQASMSGIGGPVTGPVEGTQVFGFFRDADLQEPVVMGTIPGSYLTKPSPTDGFSDPRGVYPVTDIDKQDINRMERGEIRNTHVDFKLQNITTAKTTGPISSNGARTSGEYDELFESSPQYPFNHVSETESGHMFERDDTPGFERIHNMHRSGTSEEVYADGSKTVKVYGDSFEIVIQDKNVAVYGDINVTVNGAANILVGGNANLEVNGDLGTIVRGNENKVVYGNLTEHIQGDKICYVDGTHTAKAANINLHSNSDLITRAGGKTYIQASGNVELQGSQVHMNKPTPLVSIVPTPTLAINAPLVDLVTPGNLKDYTPRQGQTLARTYITIDPTIYENLDGTIPSGFVYPVSSEVTSEDELIRNVVRREGGYVNHPADKGGPTKYGITKKTLAAYRGVPNDSLTAQDVRNLTEDEAVAIYKQDYYTPARITQMPSKTQELAFDMSVNHGVTGGANITRRALRSMGVDIPATGGTNNSLISAMNSVNQDDLYDAMVKTRVQTYYAIVQKDPTQKVFINGWLNRMKEFGWSNTQT